jgi:hypothetical protein
LAPDGEVFDFTNSPGYFHFLLGANAPTIFYHVSMTVPEFAQRIAIDQLEESRPDLVAFDSVFFGLPSWDGPRNEVRHFALAQYLLDGWTPVVRAEGVLFLLRDDLVPSMPRLPELIGPLETEDLHFAASMCDWGRSANYLESEPTGRRVVLSVRPRQRGRVITVGGWAYDVAADRPAKRVLVTVDGEVVHSMSSTNPRPDVRIALGNTRARASGFSGSPTTLGRGKVAVYAVLDDGLAHPVSGGTDVPSSLRIPGGRSFRVSGVAAAGSVDALKTKPVSAAPVEVPAGVDLSEYELLSLSASDNRPIGRSRVAISDRIVTEEGRNPWIGVDVLRSAGDTIDVRVGSCLQWHGYEGDRLYLFQDAGRPIREIRLSDVS